MRGAAALLLGGLCALAAPAAQASHDWGGMDVCSVYRDTAPPGIDPAALPDAQSRGARLLQQYCVQCHALTGPGRHTAQEWPAVLERMRMLMDVSRRFRGLTGRIDVPDAEALRVLGEYLADHALQAMRTAPRGPGADAYTALCSACHALPDPGSHRAAAWPAVVGQMRDKAAIMGRAALFEPATTAAALAFLQRAETRRATADPHGSAGTVPAEALPAGAAAPRHGIERLLWLAPFFALAALGVWRWRARGRS